MASPLPYILLAAAFKFILGVLSGIDVLPDLLLVAAGLATAMIAGAATSVAGSIGTRIGIVVMMTGFVLAGVGLIPNQGDLPMPIYVGLVFLIQLPLVWSCYQEVTKGASGGVT